MNTYETTATVQDQGQLRLAGVPFEPGTEVDVTISPRRKSAAAFATAWNRVCRALRAAPGAGGMTDDDIEQEINGYRAGQ